MLNIKVRCVIHVWIAFVFFNTAPNDSRSQQMTDAGSTGLTRPGDWRTILSYNQENNIYFWRGGTVVNKPVGSGFLRISNTFDINRITVSGAGDKWKDMNQFNASLSYPVSSFASAVIRAQSNYLSDRQSGFLNNITENTVSAELPLLFKNRISLSPALGYKWDKRIDSPDKGVRTGLDVAMYETRLGEYYGELQGNFAQENLDDRRNYMRNLVVSVNRSFSDGAADTLQFYANDMRRDYYTSAAGDLESRKENLKRIVNNLYYNISSRANLYINTDLSLGNVDILSIRRDSNSQRRSRKDERALIDITLDTSAGGHRGKIFFKFDRAVQDYENLSDEGQVWGSVPFDVPDNTGTRIELGGRFDGSITPKQHYVVESFVERYRFDTPSSENFDDHDELRFGFNGRYRYTFNQRLSVTMSSLVSLNHLVYIYKERSADNNWNRIFKAGTAVSYKAPSGFSLTGNYSVLANYVDYDFDQKFALVRSFVFRKFSLDHAAEIPATLRGTIYLALKVDLEENGLLRWNKFLQNVLIDREIIVGSIRYKYCWTETVSIEPGYSIFQRNEERTQSTTVSGRGSRLTSIKDNGVMLTLNYRVKPSAEITFTGSKRFVRRGEKKEYFNHIDLGINWTF